VKVQKNTPLVTVIAAAAGSLIGAGFAFLCIPAVSVPPGYSSGDALRDCLIVAVGAILGGLLFSWASKR
jgi:formate/nitrite transporter FocA (FNT family)